MRCPENFVSVMLQDTSLIAAVAALFLYLFIGLAAVSGEQAASTVARDLHVWVSVGPNGDAKTIQPELTVINGNTITISAAPLPTYTTTNRYGKMITTSGMPPAPTANNVKGSGSFALCDQRIGEFAPFCTPKDKSILYVGKTYYGELILAI